MSASADFCAADAEKRVREMDACIQRLRREASEMEAEKEKLEQQLAVRANAKQSEDRREGKDSTIESKTDAAVSAPHQFICLIALVVRDYDEAIAFYVDKLGFRLVEDTYQPAQAKRWVVVEPCGQAKTNTSSSSTNTNMSCRLLLARGVGEEQQSRIGNQTGGRVFLFLQTDDFWRDYHAFRAKGVKFIRPPTEQSYGMVSVFEDLYGNRWDLFQAGHVAKDTSTTTATAAAEVATTAAPTTAAVRS